MHRENKAQPFKLNGAVAGKRWGKLGGIVEGALERLLTLHRLDELYRDLPESRSDVEFVQRVLDLLHIGYSVADAQLERIPREGPAVVVANHPFGAIEGVILAAVLKRIRPDVKILANHYLRRIPELRGLFIGVDPFGGKGALRRNLKPLREAVGWLKQGGLLVMFPAGEVAHLEPTRGRIVEPPWNTAVARLLKLTGASVVPVFIPGANGPLFQLAGMVHPRLRTVMLPRELLNKAHSVIPLRIGKPLSYEKLKSFEGDEELTHYLRLHTLMLRDLHGTDERRPGGGATAQSGMEPVAEGPGPALLKGEVDALPRSQRLVENGAMSVHYARAEQIPWLLREIGRLRELTFRETGEGTGKALDIDLFDAYYLHLFVWNNAACEVVGAYRLGLADEILQRFGKKGLYTHSLFRYSRRLLDELNPAIELGRSFIRAEYQRSFSPLLLLWKGIGQFVSGRPRYRMLFGPVSISSDYHSLSQRLLVDFLKANNFLPELARHVKPRRPFRASGNSVWHGADMAQLNGVEGVSELLTRIEADNKGVPILLKQYLKLGGRLLGFNVDPDFNNALDGLIMVDLTKTDPKVLQRYMGKEAAERFLAHHQAPATRYREAS